MKRALLLVLVALGFIQPATGQLRVDPDDFEPVLFLFEVGHRMGANGSLWKPETHLMNTGSEALRISPLGRSQFGVDFPDDQIIEPGEVTRLEPAGTISAPLDGAYWFVEKDRKDDLALSQRVFQGSVNVTEPPPGPGIEIPVYLVSDLIPKLEFVNVVLLDDDRVHLRIYDGAIRPNGQVGVTVRALRSVTQPPLTILDEVYPLIGGFTRDVLTMNGTVTLPFIPSELQLRLTPDPRNTDARYIVEVEGLTEGMKLAGLITITDNVTQNVEIVTPWPNRPH